MTPTWYRGVLFDSYLEACWAASLTAWGIEWVHHPGSLWDDGVEFQPDFLLPSVAKPRNSITVFLEIKPTAQKNFRVNSQKILQFSARFSSVFVLGLPGIVIDAQKGPQRGAVWESEGWNFTVDGVERSSAHKILGRESQMFVPGASGDHPGLRFYEPSSSGGWK